MTAVLLLVVCGSGPSHLTAQPATANKPATPAAAPAGNKIASVSKEAPVAESREQQPDFLRAGAPKSVEDLKTLEKAITTLLPKLNAATVGVQIGNSAGSGVIIDKEGHVLTAAHVAGTAGQEATFILPDGKVLSGKTLGANHDTDAGLMKIDNPRDLPFIPLGDYNQVRTGTWVISTGHPGGFQKDRTPVVRFGRVLSARRSVVVSDCTIMPGDSGGPLFNLNGEVVGIHSRISGALTSNLHVPISLFQDDWDRLVKGEVWGRDITPTGPYLGVIGDTEVTDKAQLAAVNPGSPAERAGLKGGDVITKINDQELKSFDELAAAVRQLKPGQTAKLSVLRGTETLDLKVKIGTRPAN
ncbi:MAG: trypsin-like peptidase domain-containing protein [Pirellulales bacterium]|nr:trypsin-like peptidase domain-containing protein [Pirellulales bacterium]